MNGQQRFALCPDIVFQEFADEALLLNLHNEMIYQLNCTGAKIVSLIAQGQSLQEIIQNLLDEFDASQEQINHEVYELIAALITQDLLVEA